MCIRDRIWIAAIIIFGVAEAATAGLTSIWFVLGSVAGLIVAVCGGPVWLQVDVYKRQIQDSNIVRSMSRAGKPTDNPGNEALNGWIKEGLFIDFRLEECRTDVYKRQPDAERVIVLMGSAAETAKEAIDHLTCLLYTSRCV